MSLPTRYTILRSLGTGAQGEVFLAVDRYRADALVAVKVLRRQAVGHEPAREFLTLSRLHHPNIARVRDFGETSEGTAFFTTDYVGGGNLLDWAARCEARTRWSWLIQIAGQALSALEYLSRRGVSHGDIKPANLLIEQSGPARDRDSRIKLIDFGTARSSRRRTDATRDAGDRAGTLAYLAPRELLEDPTADARVDLYSLGMSLFHAAAGRLPFRLGDREALDRWRIAKKPARLRDLEPDAPSVLDSLILRLTCVHRGATFETAAEALDDLTSKVGLKSPRLHEPGPQIWLAARERYIEELLDAGVGGHAPRSQLVLGPPGSGKRAVLEALVSHLQIRGYRTILFGGRDDADAYRELCSVASELSGASLSRHVTVEEKPVDILVRLRAGRTAVLLSFDEEDAVAGSGLADASDRRAKGGRAFFRTLIRNLHGSAESGGALPFLCAATSRPDRLVRALKTSLDLFDRRHLEPLSSAAIEEVSREYFMVDSVPESVITRVTRESDGHPDSVLEALESLHCAGVRADSLGHLKIPPELPERLVTERSDRLDPDRLDPESRRALGRLAVAREALSAAALTERFPSDAPRYWQSRLEDLHLKGFCRLVSDGDTPRFQARRLPGCSPSNLLSAREEARARDELSRYFAGCSTLHCEGRLAAVWNEVARGRRREALWLATPLATTLLGQGREDELIDLFKALCDGTRVEPVTDRRLQALRLRVAESYLRCAKYEAALEALGARAVDGPPWFRRHAQKLKAKIHEARGQPDDAIAELRWLLDHERRSSGAESASTLLCSELHALLAPLCFQVGDADAGRAYLDSADDVFERCERLPESLRDLAAARVLSLFASSLAVHGDLKKSARFLEETLRLLRDGRREGPLRTALNELGILYVRSRRWREALDVFRETEALARSAGDRLSAMRATYNQAVTHYRLDDLSRAEALFHRARSLSDDLGVHAFAPTIWLGFAGVLRERGRFLPAVRLYRRVLRLREEVRPNDRTLAHNNLAEIYLQLGRIGKSLEHSREATRTARQIDNRFLLALTTCLHGVIQWSLGRDREARALIGEAEAIAREQGDPRPAGFCHLCLGRLAVSQGETSLAIGHLRRAVAASRAARDRVHLYLAMLELALLLIEHGKRKTAMRWLPRVARAREESGFARGRLVESVLAWKLAPGRPDDTRPVRLYREALDRGELWETFIVLRRTLLGDDLPPKVRQALMLERETLLARLARRLPTELRADFERRWESTEASAEPALVGRRGGNHAAVKVSAKHTNHSGDSAARPGSSPLGDLLGQLLGSGEEDLLPALLEEFRQLLGARSLAIVELRSGDPRVVHLSSDQKLRRRIIREIAVERAEAMRRVHSTDELVVADPYVLVGLPGDRPPRVICVEPDEACPSQLDWRARLSRTAGLLVACALELHQGRAGLRRTSADLAETRAEIRRLNTLITERASELETAVLTRRLEMREVQRQLDTQGIRSRRPSRTPVGQSASMKAILKRLPRIAEEKHPVLLLGESGVGKDLIARWIHELGPRRDLPYVAEVCNVSESLVEAELFGFAKGAFTDAQEDRQGLFQRVAGGSLYLDEVTEISPRLQAKILRVLEEKRIRRVGGEESFPVDFRILASSRQPARRLEDGVLLRKDLYYRLNAEVIEIPPLRDRPDDLPELVDEIVAELITETGSQRPYIHPEVIESWRDRPWPGNVRELENELQRLLLDHPHEITPDAIAASAGARRRAQAPGRSPTLGIRATGPLPSLRQARLAMEKELVLRALEIHQGNASRAAKALQVTRRYLGSLLDKHGIELKSIKRAWAQRSGSSARQARDDRRASEGVERRENASPSRRSPSESEP